MRLTNLFLIGLLFPYFMLPATARPAEMEKKVIITRTPEMKINHPDTWLTYHLALISRDNGNIGDPNCAIYYKGRYHFFLIMGQNGWSYAHVSSIDMVHWKWHPTTLTPPLTGHGMYSGTAFLTKEGKPAIIYHAQGKGANVIRYAMDDNLDEWSDAYPIEALDKEGKKAKVHYWDPDLWLTDDSYYALSGGGDPALMKSADLDKWEHLGKVFHKDFPQGLGVTRKDDVSCANFFKLGDKWMLLCISHALGCRYYLGDFVDEHYLPNYHGDMNWASWDYFAPESLLTKDGRRVMWAWCTAKNDRRHIKKRKKDFPNLDGKKLQQAIQSLPRELSLVDGVLNIKPLRELQSLRGKEMMRENIAIKSGGKHLLQGISGDTLELEVTIAASSAIDFGIKLLADQKGESDYAISMSANKDTLTVDYIDPPFKLKKNEDLKLRIFIDKSMIEVFANDRQAAVTWHEYEKEHLNISLFSKGGDVMVKKLRAWKLSSIYTGELKMYPGGH